MRATLISRTHFFVLQEKMIDYDLENRFSNRQEP